MDWTAAPPVSDRRPSRIFAVGDLHGNYEGFRTILRACELIDGDHWIGGDSQLVQLGDVFGRGGEPGRILSLIKNLESEAPAQGGNVHMLLGNHEILALRGTVFYNTREEFADFSRPESLEAFGDPGPDLGAEDIHPGLRRRMLDLGCWDFCRALLPIRPVGRWLLDRPTVLILGDTLFVHGGLDAASGFLDVDEINAGVRAEIFPRSDWTPVLSFLTPTGPQWNREYVLHPGPERARELEQVLEHHHCRRMVVGHTPTRHLGAAREGKVTELYGGKMVCADTGIGRLYGGHLSALRIEDGAAEPVYPA